MPKSYVRPRGGVAIIHPETGVPFVPTAGVPIEESDPLVQAYRWAFVSDAEAAAEADTAVPVTEVKVERATKAPGEKRLTKRA